MKKQVVVLGALAVFASVPAANAGINFGGMFKKLVASAKGPAKAAIEAAKRNVVNSFNVVAGAAKGEAGKLLGSVKEKALSVFKAGLADAIKTGKTVGKGLLSHLQNTAKSAWANARTAAAAQFKAKGFGGLFGAVKAGLGAGWKTLKAGAKQGFKFAKGQFSGVWKRFKGNVSKGAKSLWNQARQAGKRVLGVARGQAKQLIGKGRAAAGKLMAKIRAKGQAFGKKLMARARSKGRVVLKNAKARGMQILKKAGSKLKSRARKLLRR